MRGGWGAGGGFRLGGPQASPVPGKPPSARRQPASPRSRLSQDGPLGMASRRHAAAAGCRPEGPGCRSAKNIPSESSVRSHRQFSVVSCRFLSFSVVFCAHTLAHFLTFSVVFCAHTLAHFLSFSVAFSVVFLALIFMGPARPRESRRVVVRRVRRGGACHG